MIDDRNHWARNIQKTKVRLCSTLFVLFLVWTKAYAHFSDFFFHSVIPKSDKGYRNVTCLFLSPKRILLPISRSSSSRSLFIVRLFSILRGFHNTWIVYLFEKQYVRLACQIRHNEIIYAELIYFAFAWILMRSRIVISRRLVYIFVDFSKS